MNSIYRLFPYLPFLVLALAVLVAGYHIAYHW
jgi:hypothetical protein